MLEFQRAIISFSFSSSELRNFLYVDGIMIPPLSLLMRYLDHSRAWNF